MEIGVNTAEARNRRPPEYRDAVRADLLPRLERLGRVRQIARGESLRLDSRANRNLHVIESGAIKLSQVTSNGGELVVGLFFDGEVIGLHGFVDASGASLATALEPTRVRVAPLAMIEELCCRDPVLHWEIIRRASQRIAQLQQRIMIVGKGDSTERVAGFLVEMCNCRMASDGSLRLPLSLNGIGDYLCMSLETVCRSLGRLQREGAIRKRGRLVQVLDRNRLIALAGKTGFVVDHRHANFQARSTQQTLSEGGRA